MANTQPVTEKATFDICARKSSKINRKTLHRKTYFIYLCEFVYNFLFKTVRGSILSFLTLSRPFKFTFYVDFSISKEPFALQLIYSVSCNKDLNLIYFKKHYLLIQLQVKIWY